MQLTSKPLALSLSAVLISGLVSCSGERRAHVEPFKIHAPTIESKDEGRIAWREMNQKSAITFTSTDALVFGPEVQAPGIQVTVESRCTLGNERTLWLSHWTQPKRLALFQFLPPQVLNRPLKKGELNVCHFDFTASDHNGSTHRFSMPESTVKVDDQSIGLALRRDGNELKNIIRQNELGNLWITSDFSQDDFRLACDGYSVKNRQPLTAPFAMAQFNFNRAVSGLKPVNVAEEPVRWCRIFGFSADQRQSMTQAFQLKLNADRPEVNHRLFASGQMPKINALAEISILNPYSHNIYLRIQNFKHMPASYLMHYGTYYMDGGIGQISVQTLATQGDAISETQSKSWVATLRPNSGVTLLASNLHSPNCSPPRPDSTYNFPQAFVVQTKSVILEVVVPSSDPLEPWTVIDSMPLLPLLVQRSLDDTYYASGYKTPANTKFISELPPQNPAQKCGLSSN